VRALLAADPSFDVARFLEGAQGAYRMILEAFWKGDLDAVRGFLDPEIASLRRGHRRARRRRAEARQPPDRDRAGGDRRGNLDRQGRDVTVRFEADIAAVTRDAEGNVVAGSLSDAVQTRDRGPSAATSQQRSQLDPDRNRRRIRVSGFASSGCGALLALSLAACATRRRRRPVRRAARRPRQLRRRRRAAGRRRRPSPPPRAAGRDHARRAAPSPPRGGSGAAAFRISCPSVVRRTDASGLTRAPTGAAVRRGATLRPSRCAALLRHRFDWVRVGTEPAFATGYYEPEILGSRVRRRAMRCRSTARRPTSSAAPAPTADRARADRRDRPVRPLLHPRRDRGRRAGRRGLELAWAADPIDCSSSRSRARAGSSCRTAA
jgi:hypothetical protein